MSTNPPWKTQLLKHLKTVLRFPCASLHEPGPTSSKGPSASSKGFSTSRKRSHINGIDRDVYVYIYTHVHLIHIHILCLCAFLSTVYSNTPTRFYKSMLCMLYIRSNEICGTLGMKCLYIYIYIYTHIIYKIIHVY